MHEQGRMTERDGKGEAADVDDALAALKRQPSRMRGGHSPVYLYLWLWRHHEQLKGELGKRGIVDGNGKPLSAERTRKAWWQVNCDKKAVAVGAIRRRRKVTGPAQKAGRLPDPLQATVPPQAAPVPAANLGMLPPGIEPAEEPPRFTFKFATAKDWTKEPNKGDEWDDVLRLTALVRTGTVSASLLLKRLGAYPRQNGLALALREIGRIERTMHALDWLERPQLRRQATAELNKGESRNALARAVCFHRLGRLHDRTAQVQQHRASGLALVTAAIALWNTVYLGRALDAARRRGDLILDALLAHFTPVGWQHLNLTGDYLWGADASLGPDGFRPLRGTAAIMPITAAA